MFSRFLKSLTTKEHEANTKLIFLFSSCPLRVSSWMIFFPVLFFAACTKSPQSVIADKHYIEPPKQQKIPASTTALRVCADPNNLPFSNKKREGFENKIAELIGQEMNLPVEYTWWAQRRGFFRNTLRAGVCDVVIGVPASFELAATTAPYYRSSYVFVTRQDRNLEIKSLDDEQLKNLKIGVVMIGDDGTNTPPAHALANRGLGKNIVGYSIYGDYKQPNPPARIIDSVAKGEVDAAIVWGPLAGYFGKNRGLKIQPVTPQIDLPYLPFVFDIAIGVRRGDDDLKARIDEILAKKHGEIDEILDDYNVPRVGAENIALNKEGR